MTASSPHVLVIGAGAVGALFGSALARQGARVDVLCRSDYAVVARDGYSIRSPSFGDHDYENDRAMELEAILGNVVRTARRLWVDTPALDSLYALARMVAGAKARAS